MDFAANNSLVNRFTSRHESWARMLIVNLILRFETDGVGHYSPQINAHALEARKIRRNKKKHFLLMNNN
jgi:hypothetical protein